VARLPATWWLTLFAWTHRFGPQGPELEGWPDGGPALRQPVLLHQAFAAIRLEAREAIAAQRRES
jgi:hypothetical protein